MRIAVTGSIATDHLMSFPGRFAERIVADQLESISLSFLVDDLDVRRGGVAANIAFGMGSLGMAPVLVGAVGTDFDDYRAWLERHNVNTDEVRVSDDKHSSRFVCTTDEDQNQIASFYAGAMSDARLIELKPIVDRLGGLDLVLVSPNDPEAMVRHTQECRDRGYPFIADPSQQLARMGGDEVRQLIEGATYLFTNEYESELIQQSTGWSESDILARVDRWVVTRGGDGVVIKSKDGQIASVPAGPVKEQRDPTGGGDAFRAGFLWGIHMDLSLERACQVGCSLAAIVLETVGTQEYGLNTDDFAERIARGYGEEAANEIAAKLRK